MADNKPKKRFFKDFKGELKKVIWPTSKQTAKNTLAVLFLVILVSLTVVVLDFGFRKGYDFAVDKVTGGKITAQKQERAEALKIIEEMKQYSEGNQAQLYEQFYMAGYVDLDGLKSALENMKNPQPEETNEEQQPVEETPVETDTTQSTENVTE